MFPFQVDAMAQSFINNDDLRHFDPGRGTANVEVLGRSNDGALDIGFTWNEGKVPPKHGHHHSQAPFSYLAPLPHLPGQSWHDAQVFSLMQAPMSALASIRSSHPSPPIM